jgi:hypothetical protein
MAIRRRSRGLHPEVCPACPAEHVRRDQLAAAFEPWRSGDAPAACTQRSVPHAPQNMCGLTCLPQHLSQGDPATLPRPAPEVCATFFSFSYCPMSAAAGGGVGLGVSVLGRRPPRGYPWRAQASADHLGVGDLPEHSHEFAERFGRCRVALLYRLPDAKRSVEEIIGTGYLPSGTFSHYSQSSKLECCTTRVGSRTGSATY